MEIEIMSNRVFLIGAAKCGTTTVDRMLRQHPEIYMSPVKEPNFYSVDIKPEDFSSYYTQHSVHDVEAYFQQDVLPLHHLSWVRDQAQYNRLFESSKEESYLGESSTSYLYSTDASERVYSDFPDARIIVCLRDPIDRLKSHLKMAQQLGYISEVTDEVIERDHQMEPKGWGISELFLELGRYGEQLERWMKRFPREQIHIIHFEEIKENQQKVMDRLSSFLNVSIFALGTEVRENIGGLPKYPKLNAALRGTKGMKSILDRVPERWKNKLKSAWQDTEGQIKIDEDRWRKYYLSDLERLEQLTDHSYSHWKN